jgi:hypothetical protein
VISEAKSGFTYTIEVLREGHVIDCEVVKNLIPNEGLNYMLSSAFNGATQATNWYLGVFGNNYTPQKTDVMAAFPGLSGEITGYSATTRPKINFGSASAGQIDNSASRIELTATAALTVRGGFISSNNTKGGVSGVLASAVLFPSPKNLETGDVLRVTVGQLLTSA